MASTSESIRTAKKDRDFTSEWSVRTFDLATMYDRLNAEFFGGTLPAVGAKADYNDDDTVGLLWNSRLKTTAGRYLMRRNPVIGTQRTIQMSVGYHYMVGTEVEIERTMKHEMIHLEESVKTGRCGHGAFFRMRAAEIGAPRHASGEGVKKLYGYKCPICQNVEWRKAKIKRVSLMVHGTCWNRRTATRGTTFNQDLVAYQLTYLGHRSAEAQVAETSGNGVGKPQSGRRPEMAKSKKAKAAEGAKKTATTKKAPRTKAGIVVKKTKRLEHVGKGGEFAYKHAEYDVVKDGSVVGSIMTESRTISAGVEIVWVVKKGKTAVKKFPRSGRDGGFRSAKEYALKKFA